MRALMAGDAAEAGKDKCGCDDSGAKDKEAGSEKFASVWLHKDLAWRFGSTMD